MLLALVLLSIVLFSLLYTFIAGIANHIAHKYVIATSKGSSYYHDHRLCVIIAMVWPLSILLFLLSKIGFVYKIIYSYPEAIIKIMDERKKKITEKK